MLAFAHLFVGVAALTVLAAAALQDLRERLIANRYSLALLTLGIVHHTLAAASWQQLLSQGGSALALAFIVFALGYALWCLGVLGGGDVKLLVATSFLVGVDGLPFLVAGTALAGGVLALACLAWPIIGRGRTSIRRGSHEPAMAAAVPSVPYGVAIAVGGSWAFLPTLPKLLG